MPQAGNDEPQFLDDDHAAIVGFAEAYMDEDEREDFIDQLMERRGYTRVQSWGPAADPEPQQRPQRQRQPAQRQQQGGQQRRPYFKR